MKTTSEQKTAQRKASLARRDGIDPADRIEWSLQACEIGAALDLFDPARFAAGTVVSGFHPIRSEIDPRPLMSALATRGARLCLPVVTSKTSIEFRELIRTATLKPSGFGTVGPDENSPVLDPDIIILPLSVFDRQGGRIGYGAGYYDRAIQRLHAIGKKPRLIGMAFLTQREDTVPTEPHDQPLEGVITESGYLPTLV